MADQLEKPGILVRVSLMPAQVERGHGERGESDCENAALKARVVAAR